MLDVTVSVVNGAAVVGISGALVRGEGDYLVELVDWLRDTGERRITLHAAGVSSVDIDGLAALMQCHSALSASGGCLLITVPSRRLHLALRRTGLDSVLWIVDDLDSVFHETAMRGGVSSQPA